MTMTRREAIRRTALLLGVALTPSLVTGVMQAQPVTAGAAGSSPAYLSPRQFETAAATVERLLPRTETPGARDVGVPEFIDVMYGRYMTPAEQGHFAAGLAELEAASAARGRAAFSELPPGEQDAVLKRMAADAQDREKTFFHMIKELALLGYFTSEPIGRHVLHYDPVPGRFDGCIPLSEVGNVAWTR